VPVSSPSTDDPFGCGTLADVVGLRVGHHQRLGRGWQTGTTVVLARNGAVAAVDVRGGGPGTRETDALDARNLVDRIHAVCLTGGSAYGLAAADGVMALLERERLGIRVGPEPQHVVPVVPTAVIFDLGRGGGFGNRPDARFGERAAASARSRGIARGAVGAGAGARSGGIQGGVGMASSVVTLAGRRVTVAALAVVNSAGSAIDGSSAMPWVSHSRLRRPSRADRASWAAAVAPAEQAPTPPMNTTIGVVATDAMLTRPEVGRLAQSAHDGLARAIRPAHLLVDGDTVFGMATCDVALVESEASFVRDPGSRTAALNGLFAAAADAFAIACADAVLTARTIGALPAYRDLCPTAYRRVRPS
jgi:L-aminopeptidase/D-esterase-like protein